MLRAIVLLYDLQGDSSELSLRQERGKYAVDNGSEVVWLEPASRPTRPGSACDVAMTVRRCAPASSGHA